MAEKIAALDADRGRLIDALTTAIGNERDVRLLAAELEGLPPATSRLTLFSVRPGRRSDGLSNNQRQALDMLRRDEA